MDQHIYIYTPYIVCEKLWKLVVGWSQSDGTKMANPSTTGRWISSTRFCHMYNLEDSMVELNSWLTLPQLSLGKVISSSKWEPQVGKPKGILPHFCVYVMWGLSVACLRCGLNQTLTYVSQTCLTLRVAIFGNLSHKPNSRTLCLSLVVAKLVMN